ncbi:M56 family metallopeptidase [Tahibacter amnicola]|uniref:M56 family metallopeptidase n=1 Tax=Tahibacter amnicola TaxID=2976241 RepID=A0ABY6BM12_9GAMM|nr:M56 family metallopeptidase [Tahibacter amnicola]UXI69430.1 M56 family metallopeptidase [Tahibacter amnicola]
MSEPWTAAALFGATVLLHGAVLLVVVWALARLGVIGRDGTAERLWRAAVFGGVVTATLQTLLPQAPLLGQWTVPATPVAAPHTSPGAVDERAAVVLELPVASVATVVPAAQSIAVSAPSRADGPERWSTVDLLQGLLALWALVALMRIGGLLRSLRAVRRLQASAVPVTDAAVLDEVSRLAGDLGVAPVRIGLAAGIGSPLAVPGGCILLPDWALCAPVPERRAMLAHELAHIARRDPQWRLAMQAWRALAWPLPLLPMAQRELDVIAEFDCDATAARLVGDGRALAQSLARALEQRTAFPLPALALAMAAEPSPVLQRAERLLEGVPMTAPKRSLLIRLLPIAALVAATFGLPALIARSIGEELRSSSECTGSGACTVTQVRRTGNVLTAHLERDGRELTYQSTGEVRFADDESDIASLASGTAWIEEVHKGVKRRMEYTAGSGAPARRYLRDGNEAPIDADARAWLAAAIPFVLREAGIDAKARAARIYARGGARAVFDEVALIHSEHSRTEYLLHLADHPDLKPAELDAVLAAAKAIESEYEQRNLLSVVIQRPSISDEQLAAAIGVAAEMDSSYERRELLALVAPRVANQPRLRTAWLAATASMDSDFERRTALEALVSAIKGDAALADVLATLKSFDADFEKREVLTDIAKKVQDVDGIAPAYAEAARTIESAFERREAITALLRPTALKAPAVMALLDATADIDSDFEQVEVLVKLARVMPDDEAVRRRYLEVASKLSDFQREEAEAAVGVRRE